MSVQKKVKLIISLAIIAVIALVGFSVFQIIDLAKTKKVIATQQKQISALEKEIEYYESKLPEDDHNSVEEKTGE